LQLQLDTHLVKEDRVVRELDGLVDVGVVHDDERGLATELQRHRLQVAPRRQFQHGLPRARRSGERKLHQKRASCSGIRSALATEACMERLGLS